jgi:endonuclease/exonuclease/phosphatase family metal-dependent hydrolase
MRLICLNTWQGRLIKNLVPFFDTQTADLICLQELYDSEQDIFGMDFFKTFEAIQAASQLQRYTYYSPVFRYDIMGNEVAFGNGILSRYPLHDQQTIFTYGTYKKIRTSGDVIDNARNAQIVKVRTPAGDLTAVNYHAHWEADPYGSELSLQRLQKLIDALAAVTGPLIIAGDFNLWADSAPLQHFKKTLGLKDLTEEAKLKSTLSHQVTPYRVACDHIFVNGAVDVQSFQLSDVLVSDHKALLLEFELA